MPKLSRARLTRAAALTAVSFALAGSMALGVAAPAQAVTAFPDGFSPSRFITYMLSSVMAAVGNTPAKRALIANSQKYDHSYEGLDQLLKQKAAAGTPDTFTDYVIDKQKYFDDNNMTSKQGDISGKKIVQRASVPATVARKLGGTNVSGGTAVTAGIASAYFGFQIGKAASGAFGLDVNGGICAPAGNDGGFVALITGTDCSSFLAPDLSQFKANADMQGLAPGGDCDSLAALPSGATNVGAAAGGSGWGVVCRSLGVWVNRYPSQVKSLDGWFQVTSVVENTDRSLTLGWSYSGPPYVDSYNQYTSPAYAAICVSAGQVKGGVGIGRWNRPQVTSTSSGTYTSNVPNCGSDQRVWLLGYGTDATTHDGNGLYGVMYSPGLPLSAVQSQDPSRNVQCSILGSDGNTYTQTSKPFTLGSGKMAPAECPVLPDGVYGKNAKTDLIGGAGPQPLYNQPTTPQYQDWATKYPECVDGACPLLLIDKRPAVPVSCFDSNETSLACAQWMADPNKGTDYQCKYGAHDVDISECYVYGDTFKPDKIAAGQAYSDPATGLSVPGQSSPGSAQTSLGKTLTDPSNFQGCLDKGWGVANPVEWVLVPIQCGLQWAFAPRPSVLAAQTEGVKARFEASTPGKLAAALSTFQFVSPGEGCAGIPIPVPVPDSGGHMTFVTRYMLPACSGDFFAPWAPLFSVFIGGSSCVGGFFGCRRILASMFGYGAAA